MNERQTIWWFLIYVLAALVVLATTVLLAIKLGPIIEERLIPAEWKPGYEDLTQRLLADQLRQVLVNGGFGIGIVLIGITLFPLKEKLSLSWEQERHPELEPGEDVPLWRQGWEEIKLALGYLVLQGLAVYLALQGQPGLAMIGKALSGLYLILAMALDHCAPFFQRRGQTVQHIVWTLLLQAPIRTLLIGAIFVCPALLMERLLPENMRWETAVFILVLTEIFGMAGATLAGVRLGASLVREGKDQTPSKRWVMSLNIAFILLLTWQLIFFGWWAKGTAMHTRLLKSSYRPLWKETIIKIREGSANNQVRLQIALPIQIHNRTEGPIDPTSLHVELHGDELHLADITLEGPRIEGTTTETITIRFLMEADLTATDWNGLLQRRLSGHLIFQPPLSAPTRINLF